MSHLAIIQPQLKLMILEPKSDLSGEFSARQAHSKVVKIKKSGNGLKIITDCRTRV